MSLYPPIVDTYIPAFELNNKCTIKYYYSPYQDSIENIAAVHIIVQEQNTNFSVLDTRKYPTGIKEIQNPSGEIVIEPSDIAGGFKNNRYYKVQLRFSTVAAPEKELIMVDENWNVVKDKNGNPQTVTRAVLDASFLNENLSNFSEWSTVCLIRPISKPTLTFENFSDSALSVKRLENGTGYLRGQISFEDSQESEYLKSYRIKIYEGETKDGNKIVLDSGIVYTDAYSPNAFSYLYNINLIEGITYLLVFEYITNNLYQETSQFAFMLANYRFKYPEATLTVTPKADQGYIEIIFERAKGTTFFGNIMIQRTSSEDNFNHWEDIHSFAILTDNLEGIHLWKDYTAEAGVLYKYRFQYLVKEDNEIVRSEPSLTFSENEESIESRLAYGGTYTPSIQDIFLYDGEKQLKIQYDPNLSSFKKTVMDSKSETLGSQYPFIKRNAKVGYRQFSIGGLISYNMDILETFDFDPDSEYSEDGKKIKEHKGFTSDEKVLSFLDSSLKNPSAFKTYLNSLPNYNSSFDKEIYLERKFREAVIDFLYNGEVKLFKSETEGNLLVRLMDVSLTPNQQLGRKIYSFTATAYEIAAPEFDNYQKYGIIKMNDYIDNLDTTFIKVGQLELETSNSTPSIEIISRIKKAETYRSSDIIQNIQSLDMVQITFSNPPYLIDSSYKIFTGQKPSPSERYVLGYLIQINGKNFVSQSSVFVLTKEDMDLDIDNLKINIYGAYNGNNEIQKASVTVDYIGNILTRRNKESELIPDSSYQVVGQFLNSFEPISSDNVITQLAIKYNLTADDFYTRLVAVNGIHIETDPGVRIFIQDYWDTDANEHLHIMGPTGSLTFYDKENIIKSLYFDGVRLVPSLSNEVRQLRDIEYRISTDTYDTISQIINPSLNTVYNIAGVNQVYYKGNWYNCSFKNAADEEVSIDSDEIKLLYIPCKVDALIDYFIEVGEGDYS